MLHECFQFGSLEPGDAFYQGFIKPVGNKLIHLFFQQSFLEGFEVVVSPEAEHINDFIGIETRGASLRPGFGEPQSAGGPIKYF